LQNDKKIILLLRNFAFALLGTNIGFLLQHPVRDCKSRERCCSLQANKQTFLSKQTNVRRLPPGKISSRLMSKGGERRRAVGAPGSHARFCQQILGFFFPPFGSNQIMQIFLKFF
jgi:hypothetical protein